jgi:hypothetical protein
MLDLTRRRQHLILAARSGHELDPDRQTLR